MATSPDWRANSSSADARVEAELDAGTASLTADIRARSKGLFAAVGRQTLGYHPLTMFDVLVYLYETYWRPDACPDNVQLARKLTAVGFENDEIQEALSWLDGLAVAGESYQGEQSADAMRVYSPAEIEHLGEASVGFVSFLESAGVLPGPMREMVIDRAMAIPGAPMDLEDLKIIVLMVFWSLGEEPDALILDELFVAPEDRLIH